MENQFLNCWQPINVVKYFLMFKLFFTPSRYYLRWLALLFYFVFFLCVCLFVCHESLTVCFDCFFLRKVSLFFSCFVVLLTLRQDNLCFL